MMIPTILVIALLPLASAIVCYRGLNVYVPGTVFNQQMASIGCRNADYCLRSFGVINGKPGSYASCVTRVNAPTTCQAYPACLQTVDGEGESASNFTTCCCKTDLCNHDSFVGVSAPELDIQSVSEQIFGTPTRGV